MPAPFPLGKDFAKLWPRVPRACPSPCPPGAATCCHVHCGVPGSKQPGSRGPQHRQTQARPWHFVPGQVSCAFHFRDSTAEVVCVCGGGVWGQPGPSLAMCEPSNCPRLSFLLCKVGQPCLPAGLFCFWRSNALACECLAWCLPRWHQHQRREPGGMCRESIGGCSSHSHPLTPTQEEKLQHTDHSETKHL